MKTTIESPKRSVSRVHIDIRDVRSALRRSGSIREAAASLGVSDVWVGVQMRRHDIPSEIIGAGFPKKSARQILRERQMLKDEKNHE